MLRVAVARVDDAPGVGGNAAPGWMGESERRRWADLAHVSRRGFAASRALLRQLLQAATGLPADGWDVSAQAGTAPVARSSRGDITVHVSLSHRLGWVAAACAGVPVGVDIERERPPRSDAGERAALMLSPAELLAWPAADLDDLGAALLTRWTAKEAWFKARPPEVAPWDFRRVDARACAPVDANTRTWTAPPLHVAVCCGDAAALAAAGCDGPLSGVTRTSFWHVHAN